MLDKSFPQALLWKAVEGGQGTRETLPGRKDLAQPVQGAAPSSEEGAPSLPLGPLIPARFAEWQSSSPTVSWLWGQINCAPSSDQTVYTDLDCLQDWAVPSSLSASRATLPKIVPVLLCSSPSGNYCFDVRGVFCHHALNIQALFYNH